MEVEALAVHIIMVSYLFRYRSYLDFNIINIVINLVTNKIILNVIKITVIYYNFVKITIFLKLIYNKKFNGS